MSNTDSTNQKDTTTQNPSLIEQFITDSQVFSYVHKKLEKLTSAVYIVTDFMDRDDPIRSKLRTTGMELITYLSRTYAEGEREKKAALRYALNELSAIVSLCEIARSTGAVSQMNFSILKEEFLLLINMIESKILGLTSSQSISPMVSMPFSRATISIGADFNFKESEPTGNMFNKTKKDSNVFKNTNLPIRQNNSLTGNDRHEKIMSFIRKNGSSNIKDIASVIEGCSEKTVQRDLANLIDQGLISKKGERRWSVYSLKNSA